MKPHPKTSIEWFKQFPWDSFLYYEQELFICLGWDKSMWDGNTEIPHHWTWSWSMLSAEKKVCAIALHYDEQKWNTKPAKFTSVPTPRPTLRPTSKPSPHPTTRPTPKYPTNKPLRKYTLPPTKVSFYSLFVIMYRITPHTNNFVYRIEVVKKRATCPCANPVMLCHAAQEHTVMFGMREHLVIIFILISLICSNL